MKKTGQIIILIVILLLAIGLTGCSGKQKTDLETVLTETAEMLVQKNPIPEYGSVGGEWVIFGMARWDNETPDTAWFETYYDALQSHIKDCKGVLDARKYTEYSRVILSLTAIGKDPSDVAGYNLLEPLADFDQTIFQGINGPAYALLALDSGDYEIPKVRGDRTQATREIYVDYLLSKECEGGGWSLSGEDADVDATAMVLQALAKYQSRQDVQQAVERGVEALSGFQSEDGSYISYDVASSESVSQVIVALTELGIDIDDERFVKDGRTLTDRLLEYRAEDSGFRHTMDGESDAMATEQAFYALVSLYRAEQGMTSLFDIKPEA